MKKRLFIGLIGLVVPLVVVLLVRALTMSSVQLEVKAIEKIALDEQVLAERLGAAVRLKTVSHEDARSRDVAAWTALHALVTNSFPRVHDTLSKETVDEYGMVFTWTGKDPAKKPIVLCAHLDVVPVDPTRWREPPFAGVVKDGYIWGRGTLDDKQSAFAMLEAVEYLLAKGHQPDRTVVLAFGHDEEIGGQRGAKAIAELLAARFNDGAHYALDEGMAITRGVVPGTAGDIAFIGLAEKGFVTFDLEVKSDGGHSSMPPKETAVGILARAVSRLEQQQMPATLDGLAVRLFETLGPEMPFANKVVIANFWLLKPVMKSILMGKDSTRALLRTTTAPTMLQGSDKDNVLAQTAKASVNFRIKPGDTIKSIAAHIKAVVDEPRVTITKRKWGNDPTPISPGEGAGFDDVARTIREVYPNVVVAPNLVLGATDGRYYTELTERVYRFSPMILTSGDLKRIHGVDERISVADYAQAVRFYVRLLSR